MDRFVITAVGRCGSNLVHLGLRDHPRCFCDGEIVNKGAVPGIEQHNGREVAENWYAAHQSFQAAGFKLMKWDAQQKPLMNIWIYLRLQRVRVVHIERINLVRQIISQEIASQTRSWCNTVAQPEDPSPVIQINWSPDTWKKRLELHEKWNTDLRDTFFMNPYLRVYYEDLCRDWPGQLRAIQTFLGLDPWVTPVPLRKQNVNPTADYIPNIDEVRRGLGNTKYLWLFDEPDTQDARDSVTRM